MTVLLIAALFAMLVPVPRAQAGPCPPDLDGDRDACRYRPPWVAPVRVELPHMELPPGNSTVPFAVGVVMTSPVPIYTHPADFYANVPPVREFIVQYSWVSIIDSVEFNSEKWYYINEKPDEYVRADWVHLGWPSRFQGVALPQQPGAPFAFVLSAFQPVLAPNGAANAGVPALARYNVVTIFETQTFGDINWYKVGDSQWVPQTVVGVVTVDLPPEGVGPGERWVEVDLLEQTVSAYEGPRMVYATLASTGTKAHPTVPGLFRVWAKLEKGNMTGEEGKPDYWYIEDVPWIMYFNWDAALHGAYYHDSFGFQRSHGCVNLAPLDALWFFNWTAPAYVPGSIVTYSADDNPGTAVWVH